ncbi:MAG: AAA family ATPase [Candidatus Aminicenantes bacterium]|nr:AAA family ATPase [Candidatus Aminicenantes bacterium]
MKYQSLTIENFRGIEKLEINDLKRLNLLVGRNNCGKTSILEAFFLLSGMSNPNLPVTIHKYRDLLITDDEAFSYMFTNLNFDTPILLKGKLEDDKRNLKISPLYTDYNPPHSQKNGKKDLANQQEIYTASTDITHRIEGIKYEFRDSHDQVFLGQISLKESSVSVPKSYKEELKCSFLNPKTSTVAPFKALENLLVQKRLDTVISVLKNIEPAVVDIRMGGESGLIYVDVGTEKLMPMNIMGDGMRRILTLLTILAETKNGILLIDEIENGLHYTTIKLAWKAIIAACKEYDVQLIASTHSYDCIEALSDAYTELEPEGDDIRLFRIDRDEKKHTAFSASARVLRVGIEKEFEVR